MCHKLNYVKKNRKARWICTSFPKCFPKIVLQYVPDVLTPGRCPKGRLSPFVLHLKTLNIKKTLTSFLDISFPDWIREGCIKSSLESSARGKATFFYKYFFSLSDFQKNIPRPADLLALCLPFLAYVQTGQRRTSWFQRLCPQCCSASAKTFDFKVCCRSCCKGLTACTCPARLSCRHWREELPSFPGDSVATSSDHGFSGWPVSSRDLLFTSKPCSPEVD